MFSLGLVVVVVGVAAAGAACSAAMMPHHDGHDRHEGLGEHRHQCANHVYLWKREEQGSAVSFRKGLGLMMGMPSPLLLVMEVLWWLLPVVKWSWVWR